MSKRKNREANQRWALEQLRRDPHYIAGAQASGIPDEINPALAKQEPSQ